MQRYLLRRLLAFPPTLVLASAIVFSATRVMPGSLVDLILTGRDGEAADAVERARLARALGLDQPIPLQFVDWVAGFLLRGDLGMSLSHGTPVIVEILRHLPTTLELAALSLLFAVTVGIATGVFSARRPDSLSDNICRGGAILGLAVPGFWLGTLAVVLPSIWWGWLPPLEVVSLFEDPWMNLQKFFLPSVILGLSFAAATARMTRNMLLDVMGEDFVRTAWAKGLNERAIVYRHALRNVMIPVASLLGMQIPVLFGTTVIIENIFNIPGMGTLLLDAVGARDYPLIAGIALVVSLLVMMLNLAVDLSYGFFDPRVRYGV